MKITKMNNPKKITDLTGNPHPPCGINSGGLKEFFIKTKTKIILKTGNLSPPCGI